MSFNTTPPPQVMNLREERVLFHHIMLHLKETDTRVEGAHWELPSLWGGRDGKVLHHLYFLTPTEEPSQFQKPLGWWNSSTQLNLKFSSGTLCPLGQELSVLVLGPASVRPLLPSPHSWLTLLTTARPAWSLLLSVVGWGPVGEASVLVCPAATHGSWLTLPCRTACSCCSPTETGFGRCAQASLFPALVKNSNGRSQWDWLVLTQSAFSIGFSFLFRI